MINISCVGVTIVHRHLLKKQECKSHSCFNLYSVNVSGDTHHASVVENLAARMRLDLVCVGVIALSALQIACGQKPSEYMVGQLYMRGHARR